VTPELGQIRQPGGDRLDGLLPAPLVGEDALAVPGKTLVHLGASGQRSGHFL
jgi:hypothetical protein